MPKMYFRLSDCDESVRQRNLSLIIRRLQREETNRERVRSSDSLVPLLRWLLPRQTENRCEELTSVFPLKMLKLSGRLISFKTENRKHLTSCLNEFRWQTQSHKIDNLYPEINPVGQFSFQILKWLQTECWHHLFLHFKIFYFLFYSLRDWRSVPWNQNESFIDLCSIHRATSAALALLSVGRDKANAHTHWHSGRRRRAWFLLMCWFTAAAPQLLSVSTCRPLGSASCRR